MGDQRYTIDEVRARGGRGKNATWIIYRDGVYDVTSYINEHPGGDMISEEAGSDTTHVFDEVGHSNDALVILKKFKIGEIVEEEKKYDANGKKKKRVVSAPADKPEGRSCINVVTCGLLG